MSEKRRGGIGQTVCTVVQLICEVDSPQRGYVGEVAFPMPIKQVALQGFGKQNAPVVRSVHGPKEGFCPVYLRVRLELQQ